MYKNIKAANIANTIIVFINIYFTSTQRNF